MGKAGFIIGLVFGIIVGFIGILFLISAFIAPGLASWFSFFAAMFLFIIDGIIFYATNKAKPKNNTKVTLI